MGNRIALVGLGLYGGRIANLAIDQGHELVAVADPAFAGTSIAEALDRPGIEGVVLADAADIPASANVEVALIAAHVNLDVTAAIADALFANGIDVLTINSDAFDPPTEWAAMVDASAKAAGKSFLATGVQDVWWVHVPAAAAGSMARLDAVATTHIVDMETLSVGMGEAFGLGQDPAAFAAIRDEMLLAEEPVLGGPLRVLARRLGLTPSPAVRTFEPAVAAEVTRWASADREIDAGCMIGFTEHVVVETTEGVELRGSISVRLLAPGEEHGDRTILTGDPDLVLDHTPFPGDRITDVVPVNRIPDIITAAPGFHTAATMPAASYRPRD